MITSQRPIVHRRERPLRWNPVVAAIDSGRLERKTATSIAALTPSPPSSESPIVTDSGIPSSTIPSVSGSADPPASWWERLRSAPPIRSIHQSPAKNVRAPSASPPPTARRPPSSEPTRCTASAASSNATALMRTPAPNAITRPSARCGIGRHITSSPPMRSEEAAIPPQTNASVTQQPRLAGA